MESVTVIIPTMKGREKMVEKLVSTLPEWCEVIKVDDEDLLLAAKRNKGARLAKGEYLVFIDDDNYLEECAIQKMLTSWAKDIGIMGMVAYYSSKKMLVADGGSLRNYITGFTVGKHTNEERYWMPVPNYEVSEVANAFMVRKDVFNDAGGFDEVNFPIDLDEADLCKRLKNMGYRIIMNPSANCYHDSQTYSPIPNFRRPMNAYFMGRNRVLYQRKHNNRLCYLCYLVLFMPVFVAFYTVSLVAKRNPKMVPPFLKGVYDGLRGCFKNQYQKG